MGRGEINGIRPNTFNDIETESIEWYCGQRSEPCLHI